MRTVIADFYLFLAFTNSNHVQNTMYFSCKIEFV